MENIACMNLATNLFNAMHAAIEDDKAKIENPRKRGGDANWLAAGYYLSRLTDNEQLSASDMRKLFIDYIT